MGQQIVVRPHAHRAFHSPAGAFCLITDSPGDFTLARDAADGPGYDEVMIVKATPADDLSDVLTAEVPESADVLVIRRDAFLTSPAAPDIGDGRRLMIMPCASTPVTLDHVRHFMDVLERTDPVKQAAEAERFFGAMEDAAGVRLVSENRSCEFDPFGGDYEWNQQAGHIEPGEQQIAPAGELSVLPMEITDFDPARRLALNGEITLHGWPIVHAGYDPGLAAEQQGLFERLVPLHRHPVIIDVEDGVIIDCRPATEQGLGAATALNELFTGDPRYRTIWELGFGINTGMEIVPANCGLNEPYGAAGGAVHIGLGLTPWTRFALTFLCPSTTVADSSGTTLLGRRAPRINRVRSASCGCLP